MISSSAIFAIVLRHARLFRKDLNLVLGAFYWPVLDIFIWGFLGTWISQSQKADSAFAHYEIAALLGLLLWQIIGRGGNVFSNAFTEELWSNNIINLFSLPLKLSEWIFAIVLFYIFMISITTAFCMFMIFVLYDISMLFMIKSFFLFLPPLLLCGIAIGFTGLQIIVSLGKRGIELGYVIIWFLMPFSGAVYPIEILPIWGQTISKFLPMTPVFSGMRAYVMHQQDPTSYLIKGYILSSMYTVFSILLFIYLFHRSKKRGLARLAD